MFFTIVSETTTIDLWKKLCYTYERKTASSKVYLMKNLYELRMKEDDSISTHLNEFNVIFSQLIAQGLEFADEVQAIFLLCSLPSSWDRFCMAISNSAPGGKLVYNDIVGSLLTKEIRKKSMESTKSGEAHVTQSRGRNQNRGNAKYRGKSRGYSRSKSRESLRDIECHFCHKKGHMKKYCYAFKRS